MVRKACTLMTVFVIGLTGCRKQQGTPEPVNATTLLGTWSWDVESDKLGGTAALGTVVDFWWQHVSDTERYLVLRNGAVAAVVSGRKFRKIDLDFVKAQSLSADNISGSDENGVLKPGAIVVFQTAEGNFGKLQVEGYLALHDFSFPEAANLKEEWKNFVLRKPNRQRYHLKVKWHLFE